MWETEATNQVQELSRKRVALKRFIRKTAQEKGDVFLNQLIAMQGFNELPLEKLEELKEDILEKGKNNDGL
jgi:hypothetical protein